MAKEKQSALFDVIARGKPLDRQKPPGIIRRLAAWLQTNHNEGEVAPVSRSVAAPAIATGPVPNPMSGPVMLPVAPPAPTQPMSPALPAGPKRMVVDRDRREISLQVSYMSAGIALLAVLTTVAAAFLAGKRSAVGPRPVLADRNTPEQRRQLPQPGVLANLPRTPVEAGDPGAQRVDPDTTAAVGGGTPPAPAPGPHARTPGLNYVIVQSYPPAEEKLANDAAAVLNQNGIACTVVKDLPNWGTAGKTWYSVVGTDGFSRISNSPQYDAYNRKIKEISDKFAKKGTFKAFEPKPYKWAK